MGKRDDADRILTYAGSGHAGRSWAWTRVFMLCSQAIAVVCTATLAADADVCLPGPVVIMLLATDAWLGLACVVCAIAWIWSRNTSRLTAILCLVAGAAEFVFAIVWSGRIVLLIKNGM